MSLLQAIQQLRELEAKATPAPWVKSYVVDLDADICKDVIGFDIAAYEDGPLICSLEEDNRSNNQMLIEEARNALPQLLTALTEAIEVIKLCEDPLPHGTWACECGHKEAKAFLAKWGA